MAGKMSLRVKAEASKYHELDNIIARLEELNIIEVLNSTIETAYDKLGSTKSVKENLKLIANILIWIKKEKDKLKSRTVSNKQILKSKHKESPRPENSESGSEIKLDSARLFSPGSTGGGNNSARRCESLMKELNVFPIVSEFSYGNSFSFTKSPRNMGQRSISPGPCAYSPRSGSIKSTIPGVSIPNAPRISQFDVRDHSPGPIYNPSHHFISK